MHITVSVDFWCFIRSDMSGLCKVLKNLFHHIQLLDVWHSIYYWKSTTAWDSVSLRFQKDDETGDIVMFTAGTRSEGSSYTYWQKL
jgi:hypothetical protein